MGIMQFNETETLGHRPFNNSAFLLINVVKMPFFQMADINWSCAAPALWEAGVCGNEPHHQVLVLSEMLKSSPGHHLVFTPSAMPVLGFVWKCHSAI